MNISNFLRYFIAQSQPMRPEGIKSVSIHNSLVSHSLDDENYSETTRSKLASQRDSVQEEFPVTLSMTKNEIKSKTDCLNHIFPQDDIDLLSAEDIIQAQFIQSFLCYLEAEEFHYDDLGSHQNEYIHLLYQIKDFLH